MAGTGNSGGTNTKAVGNYGGFGQGDGYTNDTYGGYATPQQQYEFINGAGTYGGQLNASNPTAAIDSGNGGSMTAEQEAAMEAARANGTLATGGVNTAASNVNYGGGLQHQQNMANSNIGLADGATYDSRGNISNLKAGAYGHEEGYNGGIGSMTAEQVEAMRAMRAAEGHVASSSGGQQVQPQNTTFTPTTLPTDFNVNTSAATGIYNAGNTMANEAGYQPSQIGAPTSAQLGQYTNPWESQVVDQSLADLERSRLTAQNIGGANAGAANAFGGSRQGVAEAETNRAYADQVARTTSGLRQTGYQNAQDMARQADMTNQTAGLTGSQNRQGAATNLANVSNLGFNMGQTIQGNMDQQGAQQQQQQQQLINKAKEALWQAIQAHQRIAYSIC
tara:strand:- start:88 stop:1263 length:1176 start_codon:yes stop_codon:yes gene_type:complete